MSNNEGIIYEMFLVPGNCDTKVKLRFMYFKKHDQKHHFQTALDKSLCLSGPVMGMAMLASEPVYTLKLNI